MDPNETPRVFSERYELNHLIARGGMAEVYRAHDRLLDRPVALKVLFPELSVDRSFVERFRREAQAAANLSHPNIVPVFDWGEDTGTYFIVMEFIDGRPLSSILKTAGPLSADRTADIGAHVAAALGYAHKHGVIHRDVKPGNVLITDEGQVKVTDFGIARAINTEESLTQTGAVMGTATYFSPEQAEGIGVDARSDIYSLGVVLFEMVTGRPPFLGDTPVAVASKHVRDHPPAPRELNPAIPPDLRGHHPEGHGQGPRRTVTPRPRTSGPTCSGSTRVEPCWPWTTPPPCWPRPGRDPVVGSVAGMDATQTVAAPPARPTTKDEEDGGTQPDPHLRHHPGHPAAPSAGGRVLPGPEPRVPGRERLVQPALGDRPTGGPGHGQAEERRPGGQGDHQISSDPPGTVISTDPAAGALVKKGDTVTLKVAARCEKVAVPAGITRPRSTARSPS